MQTIRVWDLPIRLWHWTFAACVAFSLYTGLAGDISLMDWHQRSGFAILALLLFRIGWGLWGGRYVRFAHYVTTPRRVLAFFAGGLRRIRQRTGAAGPDTAAGSGGGGNPHTAPGIALVVLLFLAVAVQAVTGLFATDDIFNEGPFVRHVGDDVSRGMTWAHHRVFRGIVALIATHITAHAVYAAMRDPTPLSMITGNKAFDGPATEHHLARGLATIAAAAGLVYAALRFL